MEMNFCRRCAAALTSIVPSVYKCEKGHTLYVNAAPCVGVFFVTEDDQVLLSVRGIEPFKGMLDSFGGFVDDQETVEDDQVLLSVRGIEPFKGMLDSFGGFVDDQETVEDALAHELDEELGLSPEDYETPRFISTETGLYPFDGEERSILSYFFWSRLTPNANPVPADDVSEIVAVPLADVDLTRMDNADVRKVIPKLQALLLK
ncbi:NUDIX domain-containing protein [Candidatus Saccharibacteria bacterium]|nr:NUDIX domain-containing protein [Candidatus Saccharibacteria bacterium]